MTDAQDSVFRTAVLQESHLQEAELAMYAKKANPLQLCHIKNVARTYVNLNKKFWVLQESTAQNLFMFVRYLEAEQTDNESERVRRKAIACYKVRQRLATDAGKTFHTTRKDLYVRSKLFDWFEKVPSVRDCLPVALHISVDFYIECYFTKPWQNSNAKIMDLSVIS